MTNQIFQNQKAYNRGPVAVIPKVGFHFSDFSGGNQVKRRRKHIYVNRMEWLRCG